MTRTDISSRVIATSLQEAYAALVDEAALRSWLPPDGMSGQFEHFDARPGGSYRMVLTYADTSAAPGKTNAGADVVEAVFVELVPGRRVVQAIEFVSDDPSFAGTMTMTWSVSPVDGGTLVEMRADDVPTGISAEDHVAGINSSLANLAAHLER